MSNNNEVTSPEVDCCIVGAGPAGALLALLLSRKGLRVALLEAHADFEREFRGDTVHPSTLEILDQLGLAESALKLPHTKVRNLSVMTATGPFQVVDFSHLPSRFPYIAMIPQARLLELLTGEATSYPGFDLRMGARVENVIVEEGRVNGVRYRTPEGTHEVRARLTIGADGRFSQIRKAAGFDLIKTSPPMDVIWFRLSRRPNEPAGVQGRFSRGQILILLDRGDHWQLGYVIPKGTYHDLHEKGIVALQQAVVSVAPEFGDRIAELDDWHKAAVLSVESSRVRRWWKPGLLLIGDAAHVMSPVGGVGINYAIGDAVVTANLLTGPLQAGIVANSHLAEVQRRREWVIRLIQALQALAQKQIVAPALEGDLQVPAWFRILVSLPLIREIPARLIGYGPVRVRIQDL